MNIVVGSHPPNVTATKQVDIIFYFNKLPWERISGVHGAGRDEFTEPVQTVHPRCRIRDERVPPPAPQTASELPALQEELRNSLVVGLQGKSWISPSDLDVTSNICTFLLSPHLSPSLGPCQLTDFSQTLPNTRMSILQCFSCAIKNELDQWSM